MVDVISPDGDCAYHFEKLGDEIMQDASIQESRILLIAAVKIIDRLANVFEKLFSVIRQRKIRGIVLRRWLDSRIMLFLAYTGLWEDEAEIVKVPREDLGFEEPVVKVSLEEAQSYARLVFGEELPDLR